MTDTAVGLPRRFAALVKLEHTVFALPFAYVGMLLGLDEVPAAADWLWVTVAMVGARTLAMGLNRLIDAEIDSRNPRTAARELPSGARHPRAGARRSVRLRSPASWRPSSSSTRWCTGSGRSPWRCSSSTPISSA